MSNNVMGGKVEGVISKDIEIEFTNARVKRQEAAQKLLDFVTAVGRDDTAAADHAIRLLSAAIKEAVQAEKRAQGLQGTLDEAKVYASDLAVWRDAILLAFRGP